MGRLIAPGKTAGFMCLLCDGHRATKRLSLPGQINAIGYIVNMQNSVIYLSSGFLLTIGEERGSLHFTQFPGRFRKASPWRLALVDKLNGGYQGEIEDLIVELKSRFNAKVPAYRGYIQQLRTAGFLSDIAPRAYVLAEPSSVSAKVLNI